MDEYQKKVIDSVCEMYESKVRMKNLDKTVRCSMIKSIAIEKIIGEFEICSDLETTNEPDLVIKVINSLLKTNIIADEKCPESLPDTDPFVIVNTMNKFMERYGEVPVMYLNFIYIICNNTDFDALDSFITIIDTSKINDISNLIETGNAIMNKILYNFIVISWDMKEVDGKIVYCFDDAECTKFMSWLTFIKDFMNIYSKFAVIYPLAEMYFASIGILKYWQLYSRYSIKVLNPIDHDRNRRKQEFDIDQGNKNQTFEGYQRYCIERTNANHVIKFYKHSKNDLANSEYGVLDDFVFGIFLQEYYDRVIREGASTPGWPLAGSAINAKKFYNHEEYCSMRTSDSFNLMVILGAIDVKYHAKYIREYYKCNFGNIGKWQLADFSKRMNIYGIKLYKLKEACAYYGVKLDGKTRSFEEEKEYMVQLLMDKLDNKKIEECVKYYKY